MGVSDILDGVNAAAAVSAAAAPSTETECLLRQYSQQNSLAVPAVHLRGGNEFESEQKALTWARGALRMSRTNPTSYGPRTTNEPAYDKTPYDKRTGIVRHRTTPYTPYDTVRHRKSTVRQTGLKKKAKRSAVHSRGLLRY